VDPNDLQTVHMDGYRVLTDEETYALGTQAALIQDGEVVNKASLGRWASDTPEGLADSYPAWARRSKLAAAMLRFINELGELSELDSVYQDVRRFVVETGTVQLGLPLVATESEETHVRLLMLPDGTYLRVIEDETHEIMTVEELQRLMEQPPEDDVLGQGDLV
jgi:hypothetical protein